MTEERKINWLEIGIFYLIAVAVSAPFRLGYIKLATLFPLPDGLNSFYAVFRGIGPWVGFVVVFYILKSKVKRTLSFWGKSKITLLSAIIIPVGLAIIGIPGEDGAPDHRLGLILGCTLFLYSLGEEYGWRGYLQEALAPMKTLPKIFVIATLWFIWHLNFLNPEVTIQTHLIHYTALLAGSWGLLKITELSSSILFASAVHLSFNIMSDVPGDSRNRLIVLTVAIVTWVILLRVLNRKKVNGV